MQSSLPQPGAIVAEKYVIARLLGRGGMGAVYVVEHRVTGKKLALKCLLPEHVEHPEFVERFLREAQAAGRIEHRNVVDVFDVGKDGDLIYIVMELLDGKPLSDLLRDSRMSLEETLQILLRAMDGVAAAHAVGIVHRDLKPDNILVCVGQSGRLDDPRVLDFGISKLEDDVSKPLTKSGVMLGTPYYMSFEQINSQRDLDQRVDIYAMGVILYEAIAGQLPYVAESVGALAIRMMSGPPVPLSQLRPELPDGLADVVMRSVARDRDQRFPTMHALMEALRPYTTPGLDLLAPKGHGTPLGASLRVSRGIDATMPAMPRVTPSFIGSRADEPHTSNIESSARLKLDHADHNAGRTTSAASSSKTLLWVLGVGLLLIAGGVGLMLSLRGRSDRDSAVEDTPAALPAQTVPAGKSMPPARETDKRVERPVVKEAPEPAEEREPAADVAPGAVPPGATTPGATTPGATTPTADAPEPAAAPVRGAKARRRARDKAGREAAEAAWEPAASPESTPVATPAATPAVPAPATPAPEAPPTAVEKPVEPVPDPKPEAAADPAPAAEPAPAAPAP